MSFIRLHSVSKVFGGPQEAVVALNHVSAEIEEGEFVAIMGPSGSGKTTLLTILGGMSMPTEGKVFIDGMDLYRLSAEELADFRSQRIGFVFQQLHLMPYLTAVENVMLPLAISRRLRSQSEAALEALCQVGLEGKDHRLPGQLSSGEQARVAIARALVNNPPIILADEPTGNLDSKTGEDVLTLLRSVNEQGRTIILVTHSQEAARAARRIVSIRDGRVVADDGQVRS
jgi:putative ABC transport system ATP-binding protein